MSESASVFDSNLAEQAEQDDRELYALLAVHQEAMLTGQPIPSTSHLTEQQRKRWQRMTATLQMLDITRAQPVQRVAPAPTIPPIVAKPRRPRALVCASVGVVLALGVALWFNWGLVAERDTALEDSHRAEAARAEAESQRLAAEKNRSAAERRLADLSVSLALAADSNNDLPLAALWFAEAYEHSHEPLHRQRCRNYMEACPQPWRALHLPESPRRLLVHPSGRWAATQASTGEWSLWDCGREKPVAPLWGSPAFAPFRRAETQPQEFVDWSEVSGTLPATTRDGFVTCTNDGLLRLWKLPAPPGNARFPRSELFFTNATAQRGILVRQVGSESHLDTHEVPSGKQLGKSVAISGTVVAGTLSPDGRRMFAIARENDQARLFGWDAQTYEELFSPQLIAVTACCVECGPQSAYLAVALETGELEVREVSTGALRHQRRHPGVIQSNFRRRRLGISPDGKRLVSFGFNHQAQVWNLGNGELLQTLSHGTMLCCDAEFSPDGSELLTLYQDARQSCLWDPKQPVPQPRLLVHPEPVVRQHFDVQGQQIATVTRDGKVRVWNRETLRFTSPRQATTCEALDVAFAPDGTCYATLTALGQIQLFETATGIPLTPARQLTSWLGGPAVVPTTLQFSADGRTLVVQLSTREVSFCDVSQYLQLRDADRFPEQLRDWAEILGGRAIRSDGRVEDLDSEQWFERWQRLRRQHGL